MNHALQLTEAGSVFTNHSQENSLYFSSRFFKFKSNTTSDWLNHMVHKIDLTMFSAHSGTNSAVQLSLSSANTLNLH